MHEYEGDDHLLVSCNYFRSQFIEFDVSSEHKKVECTLIFSFCVGVLGSISTCHFLFRNGWFFMIWIRYLGHYISSKFYCPQANMS